MARPLRIEYPGAVYHVTARGNGRQRIYADEKDYRAFLELMGKLTERYNWLCHAYCLMSNHYHLLLETPDANLALTMRQLNGIYTQTFNRRHHKVGHLFQGRYKAILVDKDNYLLELCRYIVLNPVRAKMVNEPQSYAWSSYRATSGSGSGPSWLQTDWVLAQFHRHRDKAQTLYKKFVKEGTGEAGPWRHLDSQVILGDEKFAQQARKRAHTRTDVKEVPRRQRYAGRPSLRALFGDIIGVKKPERNGLIKQAHHEYGYTLSSIGDALGLHYTTISKVINQEN
jgi:putative transposase